jgi:hypothetical protein
MPDWLQQWLTQNAPWLYPLAAMVTILGGVELLFKPFRWAVPKIWSAMARQLKAVGAKQTRFNLHFVARDFPHTQWGKGSVGDKPVTCITTKWYVTNAPGSGFWMAARLVKAHLLQPAPKSLMHANVMTMSDEYANTPLEKAIPEGQTRYVIIDCVLSKLFKPGKKITVRLAVEDQLQMKHVLPPVVVSSLPSG